MSDPIVEMRDVFCVHRTAEGDAAALQGMTISLAHDEVLCVLGPSGAGKSTLLRVIAGLQVPSAGIVRVLGFDVGRRSARWRARFRNGQIGFLSQHSEAALPPDLPVGQAVELPLALRGFGGHERRARVGELLERAGLRDHAAARPGELSGGERQRVALCAAVAHRPALLLADEPTGELDEASAQAVRALIVELGTSVVIASHDPDTAMIADRAARIRDGRVVEDRRDGESALVVGRGGWLRLPSHLLTQAGIADRARVHPAEGGLLVTPASGSAQVAPPAPTSPDHAPPTGAWRPAEIELRSIGRGHGRGRGRREVIADLTRSFTPGRLTVVTGRSGAGKTTLLRLLVGLDQPDRGELTMDGVAVSDAGAEERAELRRERIGYLPQEPSPVGFLSAEENVVLSMRLRGWDQRPAAEWATVVLAQVGLADRARQRVFRLSAGEGQRVALARAVATARGLLVVDEPTSRLDEAGAMAVASLLARAATDGGQTVICASHDPEVIGRAHEVLALDDQG